MKKDAPGCAPDGGSEAPLALGGVVRVCRALSRGGMSHARYFYWTSLQELNPQFDPLGYGAKKGYVVFAIDVGLHGLVLTTTAEGIHVFRVKRRGGGVFRPSPAAQTHPNMDPQRDVIASFPQFPETCHPFLCVGAHLDGGMWGKPQQVDGSRADMNRWGASAPLGNTCNPSLVHPPPLYCTTDWEGRCGRAVATVCPVEPQGEVAEDALDRGAQGSEVVSLAEG